MNCDYVDIELLTVSRGSLSVRSLLAGSESVMVDSSGTFPTRSSAVSGEATSSAVFSERILNADIAVIMAD